jgi:hypothetical protein
MDIYAMELHEEIELDKYNTILRVPGGWIYRNWTYSDRSDWQGHSSFVPYDNEFQDNEFQSKEKPA